MLDHMGNWNDVLPLVEFTYNNSYHSSIGMAPYADMRRQPLEFDEGDHVFLRVTQITGIRRVLKSRKLTPRFLGPYQITRRIEAAAYEIALPPQLSNLHNVFHVS